MSKFVEKSTVISGVGQSDVGRRLFRDPLELTLDACLAAIADAGLTTKDIDGVATYPASYDSIPCFTLIDALGMHGATWFSDIAGWAPAADPAGPGCRK